MSGADITVSGTSVPQHEIHFPSGQITEGQPGSALAALLISANATFGFNETPHSLDTEWAPTGSGVFHGASGQLPNIGTTLELQIGDFFFRGRVVHSDYKSSIAGTLARVRLEDNRKILDNLKIHTEDIEDPPSGVASPTKSYRVNTGFFDSNHVVDDILAFDYRRILEDGATYSQILQAVEDTYNEGNTFITTSYLPEVIKLEANIGSDIRALRWKFNMTPLTRTITRILQDSGFDWYWNMTTDQVQLINKKVDFDLQESQLLDIIGQYGSASGLNETLNVSFGKDAIQDATRLRLLGGHQQGFINSRLLSPLDGLDTTDLDGTINFIPAWNKISIGFFDKYGSYRTYIPREKELQMALAGIEQWAYFKIYQNASPLASPPGYGFAHDPGSIAAQDETFQSRFDPQMPFASMADEDPSGTIRVISNRRDEQHNWVLDFYQRVNNHAQRHFGRSYVASGILFNEASGMFRLMDSAWCNIENQIDGQTIGVSGSDGPFTADYQISRSLGPISPFLTDDFRVSAHVVLPKTTVYGATGDDAPASFANWTEDAPPFNPSGTGEHYVPISLREVGRRVINPRSSDLYSFEHFPEGTIWCQLPTITGSGLINDGILANLATLIELSRKVSRSGLVDTLDPRSLVIPYLTLSGVAIPVEAPLRYGQEFPNPWVLGSPHYQRGETVEVDDSFVPWNFFPLGTQTSLEIMEERALSKIRGQVVSSNTSTYADYLQVGLPLISFDAFAEQNANSSGLYGSRSHGITDVNISINANGFTTRYKVASYFAQFGRDAPLGERTRGFLDGVINPIDFTDLLLTNDLPASPISPFLPGDVGQGPIIFRGRRSSIRVTIKQVHDVFTLADCAAPDDGAVEETYVGFTDPEGHFGRRPSNTSERAICIDGYLNINDKAIYHSDDFELPGGRIIYQYFTGGRQFGNGQIVNIEQVNSSDTSTYDVTIEDPSAEAEGVVRAICGVSPLSSSASVVLGEKATLASNGDAAVKPGNSVDGVYLDIPATAGGIPVEIISVNNQGLTSATATVKIIAFTENGQINASGTQYTNVVPIPFREFAEPGDQGFLTTYTVPSGQGKTVSTQFIQISRQKFSRFIS